MLTYICGYEVKEIKYSYALRRWECRLVIIKDPIGYPGEVVRIYGAGRTPSLAFDLACEVLRSQGKRAGLDDSNNNVAEHRPEESQVRQPRFTPRYTSDGEPVDDPFEKHPIDAFDKMTEVSYENRTRRRSKSVPEKHGRQQGNGPSGKKPRRKRKGGFHNMPKRR